MNMLNEKWKLFAIFFVSLLVKIPFIFFIQHIQEDAFITWKVAKNLLEYGVIGFNGNEKISASTTHLYVFYTYIFQFLFGQKFIYPLLVSNSILFIVGSYWISKIFFTDIGKRSLFVLLLNLTPPAITASCLGMEYGILFFLISAFLYFGFYLKNNVVNVILPILLLWLRLDSVVFLGICFIIDFFYRKTINYYFLSGILLAIFSVVGFNYIYFGEFVNHTIIAKKIAYPTPPNYSFKNFIFQLSYYGGFIKLTSWLSVVVYFLFLLIVFFATYRNKIYYSNEIDRKKLVLILLAYTQIHILLFVFVRAYFDWYYWVPRAIMISLFLIFFIHNFSKKIFTKGIVLFFFGFYCYQFMQSNAIAYMEITQRMQIAKDLNMIKTTTKQAIVLEPAGRIPFYTNLYTLDEVGLVNSQMTKEIEKNFTYAWINLVAKYNPKFILTIAAKPGMGHIYNMTTRQKENFHKDYKLLKTYPIEDVYKSAPSYLKIVYKIRPIGNDYFLYQKIK